ncbi:MAG: GTP cyclohydrolase II [Anaerolineales bacterium]|nr:GTP cyclohydrolase II [Anaerolineales bacterium]
MSGQNNSIQRRVCARIPTELGDFLLCLYSSDKDDKEHLALIRGEVAAKDGVLVRMHSECFTGDVLGSLRCDCGTQLKQAMARIIDEDAGVLIYLRQEGRGIGLLEKLKAYNLQDDGYDTVDANILLGHEPDERDYSIAALILQDLGVSSVRLLTNNPAKIEMLEESGVAVAQRVQIDPIVTTDNLRYLETKITRLNHLFDLSPALVEGMERRNGAD